MTEAEWLCCTDDPVGMLLEVCSPPNKRKLALFTCSSLRGVWDQIPVALQKALTEIELAVNEISAADLSWLGESALISIEVELLEKVWDSDVGQLTPNWSPEIARLASVLLPGTASFNFSDWGPLEEEERRVSVHAQSFGLPVATAWQRGRSQQCDLLRDIFGPMNQEIHIDPDWLAWDGGTIPKLAASIFEKRSFDRLPILADALEEAGCQDAELLRHCRTPGLHVRGCWAVDALLGKPAVCWTPC